jgi:hypothetical protein
MIQVESGYTGTSYPLTTPRIAAFALTGTATASTTATGYNADNPKDGQTWTYWQPTAVPATWTLTFTSANVSYIGIASHNCGTVGATVAAQRWTGSVWVTVATHVPTDDSPILFLLTERTAQTTFRVQFTGAIPTVGIIQMGDVTEFPLRAEFTGSMPFNEAVTASYMDTVSDGGHTLERFEIRKAAPVKMTVANLSESWVASVLAPLAVDMRANPVFIADRPSTYPASVAFGKQTVPLQASRNLANAAASRAITFEIMGFVA